MGLCITLEDIERACGGNAPYLKPNVWIVDIDDVESIPAAVDHVITGPVVLKAEKVWYKWRVSPIDPGFVGNSEGDVDSLSLPIVLTVFIPKMEGSKSKTLNSANGGEFLLIVEDKNGKKWVLGGIDDGAFLKVGVQTNDKNGYPLTFEWNTPNLPYEYSGIIAG